MSSISTPLTSSDIEKLADLHRFELVSSLLSQLGPAFLRSFYRFAVASPLEQVLVNRIGGEIACAALVSLEPSTIIRRAALRTRLALSVLGRLHRPGIRRRVREVVLGGDDAAATGTGPELLFLFTAPAHRRRGLATSLLATAERTLRDRGEDRYFVRTEIDQTSAAVAFYEASSFMKTGRTIVGDPPLQVLVKRLS